MSYLSLTSGGRGFIHDPTDVFGGEVDVTGCAASRQGSRLIHKSTHFTLQHWHHA